MTSHRSNSFHFTKADLLSMLVGSKNLFKVNGNSTFSFCCTPLHLNDISSNGESNENKTNFDSFQLQNYSKNYIEYLQNRLDISR